MKEKVEQALDKIRPMLMADGGNVELVEVTDEMGIERILKEEVPEIKEVIAI